MDSILLLKVLLSFIISGAWITIVTILCERFGTKVGGILGAMPSTIVLSLLFIGWTQTPEFAAQAAQAVPVGMIITSVFLFVFVLFAKKGGATPFILAILSWAVLAAIASVLEYSDLVVGSVAYAAVTLILFYLLEYRMNIPSIERKEGKKYAIHELLGRAALAGGIVASAVLVAEFAGPFLGGIFLTFPAVMMSTVYLLTKSQGIDFSRATGKVMLLASANLVVYGISVTLTYPVYGLIAGTILSYAAAGIFVFLISPLLKKIK